MGLLQHLHVGIDATFDNHRYARGIHLMTYLVQKPKLNCGLIHAYLFLSLHERTEEVVFFITQFSCKIVTINVYTFGFI